MRPRKNGMSPGTPTPGLHGDQPVRPSGAGHPGARADPRADGSAGGEVPRVPAPAPTARSRGLRADVPRRPPPRGGPGHDLVGGQARCGAARRRRGADVKGAAAPNRLPDARRGRLAAVGQGHGIRTAPRPPAMAPDHPGSARTSRTGSVATGRHAPHGRVVLAGRRAAGPRDRRAAGELARHPQDPLPGPRDPPGCREVLEADSTVNNARWPKTGHRRKRST